MATKQVGIQPCHTREVKIKTMTEVLTISSRDANGKHADAVDYRVSDGVGVWFVDRFIINGNELAAMSIHADLEVDDYKVEDESMEVFIDGEHWV
jgi:hypothetical protein